MSETAAPVPSTSYCALLTWKDPIKTGKVFGGLIAVLVIFKKVDLFNVFFHIAYIGLLLSAAAEYAGKLVTGQGFITKYKGVPKSYAKYVNGNILPHVAEFNEEFEQQLQKVIYSHDIETTLKAGGISYILYKITSWFSLYTLVFVAVILVFTVPAVYSKNKKEIDAAVAQYSKLAKDKSGEYAKLAHEKAAPHIETLVKKTGPVGSFISSKIPTRTAGSTVGSDNATSFEGVPEPSTAISTGASKFPDVPASSPSTVDELVAEGKSQVQEAHASL